MDRNIKTHNIKGGKRFLPILSKLRMGYPRLKIMNYQEERPIQIRNELASIANKKVKCIGRFCDIRITNEGFIHILLRDIVVKKGDKEIFLEHCWFIYDKSLMHFDNYEIKPECIISFYATVQQYKNKNRYGLGFPHQFKIIEELKNSNKKAKAEESKVKGEKVTSKLSEDTNKKVQDILKKAKEKGQITYGELATQLGDINTEQIDKVFDAFEEFGVDVLKDDFLTFYAVEKAA